MRPLVSVILPAYQARSHVARAIQSILRQTEERIELVVGDDGSTDGTREILDSFEDARLVRSHSMHNIGSLRTRNRLLGLIRGDYVAFQDSDDESAPDRIEKQLRYLLAHPVAGLVGSNCDYVDGRGVYLSRSHKPLEHDAIVATAKRDNPFVFPTIVVRRSVLERIGGFREFFWDLGNYDLDWMLRVTEHTHCANLPESLIRFQLRWASNSLTIRNPRKLVAHHFAHFLAEQRQTLGRDALERGALAEIDEFFRPLEEAEARDPSRHLREVAGEFTRRRAFTLALRAATAATRREPLRMANYRAVSYVIRIGLRDLLTARRQQPASFGAS